MLVFLFTDIEGSTRLWEQHTGEMGAIIARHDAILREQIEGCSGRLTKHTGDGVTAAFDGGEPVACALDTQVRFATESWGPIGELRIRIGLHAGAAEWLDATVGQGGDYHGPPVNETARVMSAAWGGQILLTPEVTTVSTLPDRATLLDLGQHLLKNVSMPRQLLQLLHPDLPWQEFPPLRTLSGESIRRAVDDQGAHIADLPPPSIAVALVSVTLVPMLQGDLSPDSPALVGNLGILDDLGAVALRGFTSEFAAQLQARREADQAVAVSEVRQRLERELLAQWEAGDETALALRGDASRLLQAVHGIQAAMTAATGDVKEALAQGLADLGSQFGEFRWMLAGVQDTLAEMRALQRQHLAMTEEILQLQREKARVAPVPGLPLVATEPPAFLEGDGEPFVQPVFVARERELAWLQDSLNAALAGQGRVVFVSGGPGRGKTALLDAFARQAMDEHPELLAASGTCNAYSGVGDPYLPFREVLGMLTGEVEAHWAAGTISRDHALRLWGVLPLAVQALVHHGPHVMPALVSGPALLSRARAISSPDAPWLLRLTERVDRQPARTDGLEQSHLFQQVTNVLRALAEAHPLLLILDDLQWIDTASAGLLFHLGRRLEGCRILVVGIYRPEEVALGRAGERHPLEAVLAEFKRAYGDVWLDLAEAPEPEARHFVDALLETEPNRLGDAFHRALFEHTGGHPLFTVELLRTMQERGDLVKGEAGRWVEGPALDWETLPARVEGVIEARIGRLEEELREILCVACVEGEEFTAQVVARVQEVGQRQTLRRLSRELEVRHRLVREQSALRVGRQRLSRYRFAHALFQQYLYNHLGDGERALLHGEVAGVLEELYRVHLEEVAVRLARHFTEAGDEGRALKYLILAGDGALAAYACEEAESYYRRGLALVPDESQRARLLLGLGEELYGQSRPQEAVRTWRVGIELYQELGDSDSVARLYARSARAASLGNEPAQALQLCLEGLAVVEGAPESPGLARLLHRTAHAYALKALLREGRPLAQRALEMAERLGDVEVQAHVLVTLGAWYLRGETAIEMLTQAVELAESNALLSALARAHWNLGGRIGADLGDLRAEREHCLQAAELERQAGRTAHEMHGLCSAIGNLMQCGEFEQAELMLTRARALQKDLTEPTFGTKCLLSVEEYYLFLRGEWAACAQQARARQASARKQGNDLDVVGAGYRLAMAVRDSRSLGGDASAGTWEEAVAALAEAIEIYDRMSNRTGSVGARVSLGVLYVFQGRLGDARRWLAEAREMAKGLVIATIEPDLQQLAARLASAEGRWAEALAGFEAVTAFEARCGARWGWARLLLDWAEAHAARGEPGDRARARELLRQSKAAFGEMGIPRYATLAQDRLQALRAAEESGRIAR